MDDHLREQLQSTLGDTYTLARELGGGGMSRVFVARDNALGRDVVVKVLVPELAAGVSAERFTREVKLAARLQQANIVPLLAAGESAGVPYYTMPFVRGESLRARLASGVLMPLSDAVNILRDVARALAYAHAEGVVHRDIKPDNILLSGAAAVVTDFGIAKALSASLTQEFARVTTSLTQLGHAIGTPAYMAPEQSAGDPDTDQRADVYAWGVIAWEVLSGRHPFAERTTPHAMLAAHVGETPIPVAQIKPQVPRALSELVQRCLAKDPALRPASAAELLQVLDRAASGDIAIEARSPNRVARVALGVGLLLVAGAGAFWASRRGGTAAVAVAPIEKSIAVLPFESVGGDTANVYFAEGMADELTTALARVAGLRVAATSSAFSYRNKTADVRDVGKELNVGAVLQGRVRRSGTVMRVTVQLTNATDGIVLWSNTYDREMKDVFAVQDELSRDIVAALKVTLAGGGSAVASVSALKGTADLEAYDLFLRGLHFLQMRGGGVARSIDYFRQAIARDSSFARAWAQLGTSYAVMPIFAFVRPDSVEPLARAAIARALTLDPTSAEAYAASGISFTVTSDLREAIAAFERAIALDSTYGFAHRAYTAALVGAGRLDDAAVEARRAVRIDPLSAPALVAAAVVLLNGPNDAEGLQLAARAVELDSTAPWARAALAYALFNAGRVGEARTILASVGRVNHLATLKGYLMGATGDRDAAFAFLRALEADRGHTGFYSLVRAWTYLGLNDTTHALDALEQAARAREPIGFAAAFGMRAYDPIRQTPRFANVVRAYGIDPAKVGVTTRSR